MCANNRAASSHSSSDVGNGLDGQRSASEMISRRLALLCSLRAATALLWSLDRPKTATQCSLRHSCAMMRERPSVRPSVRPPERRRTLHEFHFYLKNETRSRSKVFTRIDGDGSGGPLLSVCDGGAASGVIKCLCSLRRRRLRRRRRGLTAAGLRAV